MDGINMVICGSDISSETSSSTAHKGDVSTSTVILEKEEGLTLVDNLLDEWQHFYKM